MVKKAKILEPILEPILDPILEPILEPIGEGFEDVLGTIVNNDKMKTIRNLIDKNDFYYLIFLVFFFNIFFILYIINDNVNVLNIVRNIILVNGGFMLGVFHVTIIKPYFKKIIGDRNKNSNCEDNNIDRIIN